MTELYVLLEKMKYLKPNSIAYPPHTSPPLNTVLTTALSLSPSATLLLQSLPYIRPSATNWSGYFLLTTTFADMRVDNVLRSCRYVWGEEPICAEQYEDFEMRRDMYDEEHGSCFFKNHQVALTGASFISCPPVHDFYPRGWISGSRLGNAWVIESSSFFAKLLLMVR